MLVIKHVHGYNKTRDVYKISLNKEGQNGGNDYDEGYDN